MENIRSALAEKLVDEDAESLELKLLPGLTPEQIGVFESKIGFELPLETRELLFTNGMEGGPIDREYGIRDFSIIDPDGYQIVFGAPIESA